MKTINTVFGNIVESTDVPEGIIFLIPPVKFTRYENIMTGEVKEVMEWNPKAAGIITNINGE